MSCEIDQHAFMLAQLEHFRSQGIDPDKMTREELANASMTFRKAYETEASKNNHATES